VELSVTNESLRDAITNICGLTDLQLVTEDESRLKQFVSCYYKQTADDSAAGPGRFAHPYQERVLQILQQSYGFHTQWTTETVPALKIVVTDSALLHKAVTLSTKGSYSSTIDAPKQKFQYVNLTLSGLAAHAEDELREPFTADAAETGYDMEIEYSSREAFKASLAKYGLALQRMEGYLLRRLHIIF
jgi:hypothetical protein